MKNLCTVALCASLLFNSHFLSAQTSDVPINEPKQNQPKLFQSLPDNIPLKMENIANLFGGEVGRTLSINLSDATSFRFEGNVVSSVSKYENSIQSVVIRSTNYPGSTLTISKITAENGTTSYTGRILSMQHGDTYELKNINNQFVLVKRKFYDLVNE